MHRGLRLALEELLKAPEGADRDIVLLTDGMPDSKDEALSVALQCGPSVVTLSILGVGSKDVDEAFLGQLSSNKLVIERDGDISGAFGRLLRQAAANRKSGLYEKGNFD
jgi:hypothetical protein